ncbi:retrovirus-related pol polyprotein from transposon TNT 1-94 [Tanacetum coccineum]
MHEYLKRFVWYLDSGCSRHMIEVKQYMHKYSKESGPKVIFGDDSSGDTEGYGLVSYNGITFTRVAYVNSLKHNLISISQLCDANFKVLFTKTQGTIFNQNDKVILITPKIRDVYVIDMSSYYEESNACFLPRPHQVKMENINEVKVKELRSDNETEFKNHKLEEFYDENGISQNFSFPCTPEQNGVAERRNRTLIEVIHHNKTHRKTAYDVFRGRSPDISYFHVFGCPVHIHNHKDHLGKFDEKVDDGFFLGYSLVAKAFKVFNIRRQEMEIISFFDDELLKHRNKVTQCSDSVSPVEPPEFTSADDHPTLNEHDLFESADILEPAKI